MMDEPYVFDYYQLVQKRKGYRWPGSIVSRFRTNSGKARYVVECMIPEVKGALHIYAAADLKRWRPKLK